MLSNNKRGRNWIYNKFNTNAEEYFFKLEEFVVVDIGKDLAPNTLTLHLVVFTY